MGKKCGFFDQPMPCLTEKDIKRADEFDKRESGVDSCDEKKGDQLLKKYLRAKVVHEVDLSFKSSTK